MRGAYDSGAIKPRDEVSTYSENVERCLRGSA